MTMVPNQATSSSGPASAILDDLDELWGNRSIVDDVKTAKKRRRDLPEARSGNSKHIHFSRVYRNFCLYVLKKILQFSTSILHTRNIAESTNPVLSTE